ncbi:MAG: hypothetical protein AAFP90_24360, partial [Planctomycetota bacterium]
YLNLRRPRFLILVDKPEDAEAFFQCYPKFAAADIQTSPLPTIADVHFEESDDHWHDSSIQSDERYGVRFATNTWLAQAPTTPHDNDFVKELLRILQVLPAENNSENEGENESNTAATCPVNLRPVLFSADDDWNQAFAWGAQFVNTWTDIARRAGVLVDDQEDRIVMPSYCWVDGHETLHSAVDGNPFFSTFGIRAERLAIALVRNDQSLLAQAARNSYRAARETQEDNGKPNKSAVESYEDSLSNLLAAAHSWIKYRLLGAEIAWRDSAGLRQDSDQIPESPVSFHVGNETEIARISEERRREIFANRPSSSGSPLATDASPAEQRLIDLGEVEHNR